MSTGTETNVTWGCSMTWGTIYYDEWIPMAVPIYLPSELPTEFNRGPIFDSGDWLYPPETPLRPHQQRRLEL